MKIVIGVTGASGAALAAETLRQLREAGAETHLVMTGGARITIAHELGPHRRRPRCARPPPSRTGA